MKYNISIIALMLKNTFNYIKDNRYYIAKISLSMIIIALSLATNFANKQDVYATNLMNQSFTQQEYINFKYDESTVDNFILLSKAYDWSEASSIIPTGDEFLVIDVETGQSINMQRTGGHRHYDVETVTKNDTDILRKVWGGEFNWSRRGILILYKNNFYIASMHGMPHAGLDKYPAKELILDRSCGFGAGVNYDIVKNNDMDGHICIHFINSTTHGSLKIDALHQNQISKILNMQKEYKEQ